MSKKESVGDLAMTIREDLRNAWNAALKSQCLFHAEDCATIKDLIARGSRRNPHPPACDCARGDLKQAIQAVLGDDTP